MLKNYKVDKITDYLTGELRAMTDIYNDPVTLNFRFLIDFKSKEGLFADESNVNSALAYLKRIGQNTRYELLKTWIKNFKTIIDEYEHLFMSIEGLDIIQNANPTALFGGDSDKINIKIYEPIDWKFHSLITAYRHIYFDDERGVEILPINLRYFDCSVFVFNAGYYNELLYGTTNTQLKDQLERKIFPTKDKLINRKFDEITHILFNIHHCEIDVQECGKDFINSAGVTNEMRAENVFNNFNFRFKFADYTTNFQDLYDGFDLKTLVALESLQRNNENDLNLIDKKFNFKNFNIKEYVRYNDYKNFIRGRGEILKKAYNDITSDGFKKQAVKSFITAGSKYARNHVEFIRRGMNSISQINSLITGFDVNTHVKQLPDRIINKSIDNSTKKFNKQYNVYDDDGPYSKNVTLFSGTKL